MKTLLGPMRVPFLVLGPVCWFLGMAAAVWTTGEINWPHAVLALIGAVAAHISVNAFNEYFDFRSGLDFNTQRTPFSGGSGTLPANPQAARQALITAVVTAVITAGVGVFFLLVQGWWLLPLGLLGLLVVYTYTNLLTRTPFLCLIAPGLGFGTLMVMGTYFALTGKYTWTAFVASFVPFFLVSNLLLLNQFPDVEADRGIGRKHYPITLGRKGAAVIYVVFLILTYVSIVAGVAFMLAPRWTLLGLLTLLLAVPVSVNVLKNADNLPELMPSMGMNVLLNLLTPLLVGIGFLIG